MVPSLRDGSRTGTALAAKLPISYLQICDIIADLLECVQSFLSEQYRFIHVRYSVPIE